MTFKRGKSGNPAGRPKGAVSKRLQLSKMLEPYSQDLINKAIELAMAGDTHALRLCIERLVPKIQRESIDIELPSVLDEKNISKVRMDILSAALDGRIGVDHAQKLIALLNEQVYVAEKNQLHTLTGVTDPVEASKIYQRIMMEN